MFRTRRPWLRMYLGVAATLGALACAEPLETAEAPGAAPSLEWVSSAGVTALSAADTGAPDTFIDSMPPDPSNQTTATFSFSATEPVSRFECTLDAAPYISCNSPFTTPSLEEGVHTFSVRAVDRAGNEDPSPATYTWIVDVTPPHTDIMERPANPTNQTSATFSFKSDEPGTTFECSLDGEPFAACAPPKPYSPLADGSHTFLVRARDPAGNVEASPASYTWFVDTAPPDTFITSPPPTPPEARITFTSNEAPVTFECRLDLEAFTGCTSPVALPAMEEGSHTFQVRAIDAAGNVDPTPASISWTVDTVAPETTVALQPRNPSNASTATFAFTSNDSSAIFECKLDAEAFTPCTSPKTYVDVENGSHTFQVRARDPADNVDASPASYTWVVDTVAPDTFITSPPPNSSDATITFTSNEAPVTFMCRLDSEAFTGCTSPVRLPTMTEGSHTFQVHAIDAAGNMDPTPATLSWTVDTTAPHITFTRYPSNPSRSSSATFAFSSSEEGVTFECKLDTTAFVPCTSPSEYTGLTEGPHTFQVRAIDAAGNTTMPASFTWVVDTHAPEAPIIQSPSQGATITQRQPTISGTAQPGSTVALMLDDAPLGTTTASSLGQWTLVPASQLSEGPHTLTATAQDEAGNSATSAPVSFTLDAGGPPDGGDDEPDGGGGCGCGAGSTDKSLLLWGLGLLATLGARRRARPTFNHP